MLKIVTIVLLLCLLSVVSDASEPYCVRNESVVTRIPVTKTRRIVKTPTGFFKAFKKTKTYTEAYQDFEERVQVRVVRNCCDGHTMSQLGICEPVCANGCPSNSKCVEPNRCQCQSGFISAVAPEDGAHFCEPICHGGCPHNARCVEPDVCECERGYHKDDYLCKPRCASGCPFGGVCTQPEQCSCVDGYAAEQGTCVPICQAGDGCLNGRCLDRGYEIDPETRICEKVWTAKDIDEFDTEEVETSSIISETSDEEEDTTNDSSAAVEEDNKFFLTTPSEEESDEMDWTTFGIQECPPSFILYRNTCRPQVFASNETDCRFRPCADHAICQSNGTCACEEGYSWFKPETLGEQDPASCLTYAEISAFVNEARKSQEDEEDDVDWTKAGFIALGALCMAVALCMLIVKLVARKKGKMDVEAKNDLYCTYDSRDIPHVL